ncbi:Tmtc4 [Symbiodinium sp. CCMP2592]|nr:Tmtc4 [Symbiodinium sp. CCMP2592]
MGTLCTSPTVDDSAAAMGDDSVNITGSNLSGSIVWGPDKVSARESVESLRRLVARGLQKQPHRIRLVKDSEVLQGESTLASRGLKGEVQLQVLTQDFTEKIKEMQASMGVKIMPGLSDAEVGKAEAFPYLALLVGQLLILATYAQAFWYAGFIMDDTVGVSRNPNVVGEAFSFNELMRRDFWGLPMHGSGWTNKSFRPLTTLTFRWNYLLHGLDSSGFHVTNVLLHSLTSLLVGRTATVALGLPGSWAVVASVFFGIHPVHTENVLYLVCRADILACLLGLMAINAYGVFFSPPGSLRPLWTSLRVRPFDSHCFTPSLGEGASQNPVWLAVPVALIVASGLCKESGFTLFAIPFLMELLDFLTAQALAHHHKERLGRRVIRRLRLRVGLLLASTICVFVARYRHTGGTKLNMSPQDNPISFESEWKARVLSYSFLHGVYMRLLVWPQYLCYDYSMDAIPIVREMTDCRMLLPLAAYVGAIGTVSFVMQLPARHRRAGLIALALLVISYLPASNILFPVGTVVGERLLYVPSAGYCLAVIVVLHAYLQGAQSRPWVLPRRPEQNGTRHISRAGAPQVLGQQIHSWGVGSGRAEARLLMAQRSKDMRGGRGGFPEN